MIQRARTLRQAQHMLCSKRRQLFVEITRDVRVLTSSRRSTGATVLPLTTEASGSRPASAVPAALVEAVQHVLAEAHLPKHQTAAVEWCDKMGVALMTEAQPLEGNRAKCRKHM